MSEIVRGACPSRCEEVAGVSRQTMPEKTLARGTSFDFGLEPLYSPKERHCADHSMENNLSIYSHTTSPLPFDAACQDGNELLLQCIDRHVDNTGRMPVSH